MEFAWHSGHVSLQVIKSLFDLRVVSAAGIAFITIFAGQNFESQRQLNLLLDEQRGEVVQRAERVVASVISERGQRMIAFTEILAATQSISSFMRTSGSKSEIMTDTIAQFIINTAANGAYFFSIDGELLSGNAVPEAKILADSVLKQKMPGNLVKCTGAVCDHYVAVPVLHKGEDAGVIVASYDLSAAFAAFENATGAKVSVQPCMENKTMSKKGALIANIKDIGNNLPDGYCYRAIFDTSREEASNQRQKKLTLIVSVIGLIILAGLLLVIYILNQRIHHRIVQEEAGMRKRKSEMLDQLSRNFEDERRMLAAELHDELGQRLVPIRFNVHILKTIAESKGMPDLVRIASLVESGIGSMSKGVSDLIISLRPPLLDTIGLKGSIESIVSEFRLVMPNCDIQFHQDGRINLEEINDTAQVVIYRAIQESLTNISKHAQSATKVVVGIFCTGEKLEISITDNGPGISKESSRGMGLRGMRDRVFALNGKLSVKSAVGSGTSIVLELPSVCLPEGGGVSPPPDPYSDSGLSLNSIITEQK
jgi:signal transduction histidine kinase